MNIMLLKSKRVLLGVTQEDIASALGISRTAYSKKENAKNPFTREELETVKGLLKLSSQEFMDIFFENQCDFKSQKEVHSV